MRKLAYNFTLEEAYAFMGLPMGASPEEVKNKYHILSVQYHPDLGGDQETMKKLNRAKKVIDANKPRTRDISHYRSTAPSSRVEKTESRLRVEEYIRDGGLINVYRPGKEISYWGEAGQEDGLGYFIMVDSELARLVRRKVASWPRGVVSENPYDTHRHAFLTPEIVQEWIRIVKDRNKIFDRDDVY